ncbi:unnamed protein product [Paramecium octaurelia]|uniref:Uncharacterized protein n=1 Tax=Paramecium octaurelia TaxID=43137 RepID=A0A8S1T9T7_PAROT|nr:unnamed protein product [Paramecium octaurelia]
MKKSNKLLNYIFTKNLLDVSCIKLKAVAIGNIKCLELFQLLFIPLFLAASELKLLKKQIDRLSVGFVNNERVIFGRDSFEDLFIRYQRMVINKSFQSSNYLDSLIK